MEKLSQYEVERLASLRKHASRFGHDLEYLEGVLTWLTGWIGISPSPTEYQQFLEVLARQPKWKLHSLDEYHPKYGKSPDKLKEYFDSLQEAPQSAREEIGTFAQIEHVADSGIANDSMAHIKMILNFEGPRETRLNAEIAGLRELHRKYPHAGFDRAFVDKRFLSA